MLDKNKFFQITLERRATTKRTMKRSKFLVKPESTVVEAEA